MSRICFTLTLSRRAATRHAAGLPTS